MSELASALTQKYIAHDLSHKVESVLLDSLSPESIENSIKQGSQYHIAELDDIIIGIIGFRDNRHLYHLFVNEQYQKKGIARQLWFIAREQCIKNGNAGVFTVNSSVNAKSVYEKFGFVSQSDVLERNGITYIPMKLTLSDLT